MIKEAEIKKAAKAGNNSLARTLAKNLVKLRQQRTKHVQLKSTISGVNAKTMVEKQCENNVDDG
jgi:hypothetical protein